MHSLPPRLAQLALLLTATLALGAMTGCERTNAHDQQHDHDHDHADEAATSSAPPPSPADGGYTPALPTFMTELQHYSQKLGYSLEAKNAQLAGFYMIQIDRVLTEIETHVATADGLPVPPYIRALMWPSLEPLDHAIDEGHWEEATTNYKALTASCNACHNATNHAFIKIKPASGEPPFNQAF